MFVHVGNRVITSVVGSNGSIQVPINDNRTGGTFQITLLGYASGGIVSFK